jgi:alanine racemase
MPRPLVATIHIPAMRHNLARAKALVPTAKVWAVVKAYAYGHGLAQAVKGFAAADGLALIELEGATRLRELGWEKPILLLEGFFEAADLHQVVQQKLEIVVHCEQQIVWLEQAQQAGCLLSPLKVHLKMNSGMNRLGFMPAVFAQAHARLRALPGVGAIVLMTHFANADKTSETVLTVAEQMRRFAIGSAGLPGECSFSNSSATLNHTQINIHAEDNWVRPGIMLYGGVPFPGNAAQAGLLPAMSLRSELISIQEIAAGEAVGYSSRFIAPQPMRIGIVACGYADGYPRHATVGTPILVEGIRTGLIGQVSMDMITVDLTPIPTAAVGSPVTLWGEDLSIDEVAHFAGTISYELMCALAPRVRLVVVA